MTLFFCPKKNTYYLDDVGVHFVSRFSNGVIGSLYLLDHPWSYIYTTADGKFSVKYGWDIDIMCFVFFFCYRHEMRKN